MIFFSSIAPTVVAETQWYTERGVPFEDARRLVAGWVPYQLEYDRKSSEPSLLAQAVGVNTLPLYGPDDEVVPRDFSKRCEIAFPNRVGPVVVPDCGHFLQWEPAEVLNGMAEFFFAGLCD